MSLMGSLNTSASALTAQTLRMDVISENIANVNTTRTADGGPYQRKTVVFQEQGESRPFSTVFNETYTSDANGNGIRVSEIVTDSKEGALVYDPTHPDADADGYVMQSNVNIVQEMTDMISASRSYEANVTAMAATKSMITKTLEIGK